MSSALVAYVPTVHQGYLNLFRDHPGELFILGSRFTGQVPRLERNIAALEAETVAAMLRTIKVMDQVYVLNTERDIELLREADSVVMPAEDVSTDFAGRYLVGVGVTYVSPFLRWDKQISTTEFIVPAGRIVTFDDFDREVIGLAARDAARSPDWWRQVGAAIVKDGRVILVGHNRPLLAPEYTFGAFGDPRSNFDAGEFIELSKAMHAEPSLIAEAARLGIALKGASIYVTTFPCPVCAKLIAAAGIKRVYYELGYSLLDAEDIFSAFGVELVLVKR